MREAPEPQQMSRVLPGGPERGSVHKTGKRGGQGMDLGPKGWGSHMGEMISGSNKRKRGKEDGCIEKGLGLLGP